MRLGIVQFGNYRDAFDRFRRGGSEDYYAQRYSVDLVERWSERLGFAGVCVMLGGAREETQLTENLFFARTPLTERGGVDDRAVIRQLEGWRIDRLVLQTPRASILEWALANAVPVLPVFADSWRITGPRSFLAARRLARLLGDERVVMVANHNIPASLSLEAIGVSRAKIFPWDWPHALRPHDRTPKKLPGGRTPTIVFVGAMIESKGPGDCIRAAAALRDRNLDVRLMMIGGGPFEADARRLVSELGLTGRVEIAGRLPHENVVEALSDATLSVVPSWRSYAEGLPMTIYEALATRTPLVVSDHPMFQRFLADVESARMVPERRPDLLADALRSLLEDPAIYQRASEATLPLWERIRCDLEWGHLIETWLADPKTAPLKLKDRSLEARLQSRPEKVAAI